MEEELDFGASSCGLVVLLTGGGVGLWNFKPSLTIFKESITLDQEICKVKGLPIAGYDDELDSLYIEYPDGRRAYPNEK